MSDYEQFINYEEIFLETANGLFLSARDNDEIYEQENKLGWEKFLVIPRENEKVIFRSSHFNKQISARTDGTVIMIDNNQEWEEFTVEKVGDAWVFKSFHNNYMAIGDNKFLELKSEIDEKCYFKIIVIREKEKPKEPEPEPVKQPEPEPVKEPEVVKEAGKIPKFNFNLKYKIADQMPFDKLRIKDIFFWRNIYASLIVLIAFLCLVSLLGTYQYPVLILIARLFQLQIICLSILPFAHKLIFKKDIVIPTIADFEMKHFCFDCCVECLNKKANCFLDTLLRKVNLRNALFAFLAFQGVAILACIFSGLQLFVLTVLVLFVVPRLKKDNTPFFMHFFNLVYEKLVVEILIPQWEKFYPQIPENVRIPLEKFFKDKQE